MKTDNLKKLSENASDLCLINDFLKASGFQCNAVCDALGIAGASQQLLTKTAYCSLVYYNEDAVAASLVGMLGTLFILGGWIKKDAYESIIHRDIKKKFEEYELVENADQDYIRSTVSITELDGCFFFSDRMLDRSPFAIELTQDDDNHVDPPNYSSVSLYHFIKEHMVSKREHLLDIGCGTGCQSILSGSNYNEVTGIDINSRCILFSKINGALNHSKAGFRVEDCLSFSSDNMFDTVYFNVPSVPKYRSDLTKIDTYTSRFGYSLAISFINKTLPDILTSHGTCIIWSVFAVTEDQGSVPDILRNKISNIDSYDVRILTETDSPFGLSEESIARNTIPRDSYLLADPGEKSIYLNFLKENRIIRISPQLIQLTPKTGSAPVMEEQRVASFVS